MTSFRHILKRIGRLIPKTYMAFPVEQETEAKSPAQSKRGVALVIAIMAVAMIMIFSSNMIVTSTVNLELSSGSRDSVKAEYMAKSGANLAIFLLSIDWAIDLFTYKTTQKPPSDSVSDIWAFMNGMPIGGETMEMLMAAQKQFDLNALNDEKVMDTLKLFDGQFIIDISDELSKINIAKCNMDACRDVVTMLEALMSCPSEKAFLEKKNLIPRQMAYRIKDWIDANNTPEDTGLGSEDDPYEKKVPPYSSKNVPMESINELRLIEGWDDEMHAIFSPYITIYPYIRQAGDAKQLNINTANKELLGCLVPSSKVECADKFLRKVIEQEDKDKQSVLATDKQSLSQFLTSEMCYQKEENSDRTEWFTYRSSVFRIKVKGEVNNQEKTLEMVIERGMPDKAKKIDQSYSILYWKMI